MWTSLYHLGCYDALTKLGAKLTPEQLADYRRQVALREARLPSVHIPGAELIQKPTAPAAMQMHRQLRQLLEDVPLVGGNRAEIARQATAREAALTQRLQATGRLHARAPGSVPIPINPALEKTLPPPYRGSLAFADTLPHAVPPPASRILRKPPMSNRAFARIALRHLAHI